MFSEQHKDYTCIAHNSGRFDNYLVMDYIVSQSMIPNPVIFQGSKILYMHIGNGLNIRLIDSLSFLPMSLASLPKAFGFTELKKGYFPHFFNTRGNQTYVGAYPEPHYYGADYMSTSAREDFMQWYAKVSSEGEFNFQEEMLAYCRSDVDILRRACLKFREQMLEVTGTLTQNEDGEAIWGGGAVDPFNYMTIASVCMGVYHSKFLEEHFKVVVKKTGIEGVEVREDLVAKRVGGKLLVRQQGQWQDFDTLNGYTIEEEIFLRTPIAKDPRKGYTSDQYSRLSIVWLQWMQRQNPQVSIEHALTGGGERKVKLNGQTYRLDGYYTDQAGKKVALEYQGCLFHGCWSCYPHSRKSIKYPLTGQSMDELYRITQKKRKALEMGGFRYIEKWECEFRKDIQSNQELSDFEKSAEVQERLNPRDSFFGGRTNATKLHYKVQGEEKVKYVDFTSLYPYTNKYGRYPVGHPEIITQDFGEIKDYFGIAKVKVLPPRGLYHPVLPMRSNGKLKFPLCRTCAEAESKLPCRCTEDQRAIIGTWCTPELEEALARGYKILSIYEVWN
jgi:G:T-mismatch repair DNA endonuclease (very short patch repair protein)